MAVHPVFVKNNYNIYFLFIVEFYTFSCLLDWDNQFFASFSTLLRTKIVYKFSLLAIYVYMPISRPKVK